MDFRLSVSEKLLEVVSRLYFIENKKQTEIAADPRVLDLWRLSEARSRKPSDFKDQKRLRRLSQTTVNRVLQRAKQLGVVAISVNREFAVEMSRDSELSRDLRNAFFLKECSVLRPVRQTSAELDGESIGEGPASSAAPVASITDEDDTEDVGTSQERENRLILGLANFTAGELRGSLLSGDHILCGGGRTICWLARALRRDPPSKRDLIFSPLSGRLWLDDWRTGDAEIMEQPLDADDAVRVFAEAFEFEPGGRFSQVNHPLYEQDEATAKNILEKHCALGVSGEWNWNLPPATRAFVGIGWLQSEHHRLSIFLKKYEKGESAATESYLATAAEDLQSIQSECNQFDLPLPGDVANRLFPCVLLPEQLRQHHDLKELRSQLKNISVRVDRLNRRAIVMSWKHLRRTRNVRAIAAGTKLNALWTILLAASFDAEFTRANSLTDENAPLISDLTTDKETAVPLLSAIEEVRKDQYLATWYKKTLWDMGLTANHFSC